MNRTSFMKRSPMSHRPAKRHEVRTFKDGRIVYSGPAYRLFKWRLMSDQKFRCRDCGAWLTLDNCDVHHEGESGYGRGMSGSRRNDQSQSEAKATAGGLKNWAVALCQLCHRKVTHGLHWARKESE